MKWLVVSAALLMTGCQQDESPSAPVTPKIVIPETTLAPKTTPNLPGQAAQYLSELAAEIDTFWVSLPRREFPAGLIEQESNWKVSATLKTSRELGVGLGQFTKAYNADGSVRFDALAETKQLDKSLAGWSWQDPYNAQYQIRAVVLKLRANDKKCSVYLTGSDEQLACGAAVYNGGAGSITKRIRMCQVTAGCDDKKWFGNLDHMVAQSTVRAAGYGESFAEINSKYPARVFARMKKYVGLV